MLRDHRLPKTRAGRLLAAGIAGGLTLGIGTVAGGAVGLASPGNNTPEHVAGAPATKTEGNETQTQQFVNLADGASRTVDLGAAGTVTIMRQGDQLVITSVSPGTGFTVLKQQDGDGELQVRLTNGTITVRFDAHLEDGLLRLRIRQVNEAPEAAPATTPTTENQVENEDQNENANENEANEAPEAPEVEHQNEAPEAPEVEHPDQPSARTPSTPSGDNHSGDGGSGGSSGGGGSSDGGSGGGSGGGGD